MKILMVLASHDKLGSTGRKTGFWLEGLASPYFVFKDAGAQIVLASPKGGQPPLVKQIREGITRKVRFNSVVGTGVPGFIPRVT